ncbi:hypothetical protein APHCR_1556 [Anaplasma phagocytophilum str. CR1007]|nr:hypothetical protein APHCR_1556 [Anaplasma phagocytophilum str. CR1007]
MFPSVGSGHKYGESVSTTTRSLGTNLAISLKNPAFLKVRMPENEI